MADAVGCVVGVRAREVGCTQLASCHALQGRALPGLEGTKWAALHTLPTYAFAC
jgi:hypothetical protein